MQQQQKKNSKQIIKVSSQKLMEAFYTLREEIHTSCMSIIQKLKGKTIEKKMEDMTASRITSLFVQKEFVL